MKPRTLVPTAIASWILVAVLLVAAIGTEGKSQDDAPALVSVWGRSGAGPGEFAHPFDVAVDREGFVYVTDTANHRVQKFTADGSFLLQWGARGTEPGQFVKPVGIAIGPDSSIYVSDFFSESIQKFTPKGTFLLRWGKHGNQPGEFDSPSGLAVSPDASVYVVDEYNFRVQKFTAEGGSLKVWGEKGKINVVVSALNFLLTEGLNSAFYYPARIAVGPAGQVYVSDSYNNRVQVFTPDGVFVRKWGGLGLWGGRFRVSSGIAFGPDGRVYVADF